MNEGVSACIVTRGDHDLQPIIYSLADAGIPLIKIWDNSKRDVDLAVYGRYALIEETDSPLIFVQDDDVLMPPESIREIIWECDSGSSAYGGLVCNMPSAFRHGFYEEHSLVGFGACFHRSLPAKAFETFFRYLGASLPGDVPHALAMAEAFGFSTEPNFLRTCDVVFTALTPHRIVDVPYYNLEWAEDANRMYRQPGHMAERSKALELAFRAKDAA